MRIGIDVDGVLAAFNHGFMRRIKAVTSRDLFPLNYEPTIWNYPESVGYTMKEVNDTWTSIKGDGVFWLSLPPYRDACHALGLLSARIKQFGDDVYFITARPGKGAKMQTEQWLRNHFPHLVPPTVTVLITSHKGLAAQTLGLDIYIDDRLENCYDTCDTCQTFLMDRPWNQPKNTIPILPDDPVSFQRRLTRVSSIAEMLTLVGANGGTTRTNESGGIR